MSSTNQRGSNRRRRKPAQPYHATPHSTYEERLLQQAIENSKLDQRRPSDGRIDVPSGPTFYPTIEEFERNPLHYIDTIRPVAEKYGICKIVPPEGWNPPFCVDMESKKKFQTKEQQLHRLQEGISFGDGQNYCAADYLRYASHMAKAWRDTHYPASASLASVETGAENKAPDQGPQVSGASAGDAPVASQNMAQSTQPPAQRMTPENLERDYWDLVETHREQISVDYGNDVDTAEFGSGFPLSERGRSVGGKVIPEKVNLPTPKFGSEDFYKETGWNLNNIPNCDDSILRHVKVGINGINVPWMYYGCLFSTFCWHNEDNYLYSINYNHKGAPKQWYGVPGTKKDADGLERVFKNYLSLKMRDDPDLLHHITTMFSPRLLQNGGVPVCKILQHAGEFVVTFPRAFHGGFSMGPNVGEAVNFATHDWIVHGADANERYRSFARPAVFSHDRLTFTMASHLCEQKKYSTCSLLVAELERVIEEEMKLRRKLLDNGVRDVSSLISLPKNRLDQLDEESADYDDKRLCHACKHVCFFSAVACECSQSKVSCLRHSHYMCRCPTERKYLMIWSTTNEMTRTLETVKAFSDKLKQSEGGDAPIQAQDTKILEKKDRPNKPKDENSEPPAAPGSERDRNTHMGEEIDLTLIAPIDVSSSLPNGGDASSSLPLSASTEPTKRERPEQDAGEAKRLKMKQSGEKVVDMTHSVSEGSCNQPLIASNSSARATQQVVGHTKEGVDGCALQEGTGQDIAGSSDDSDEIVVVDS